MIIGMRGQVREVLATSLCLDTGSIIYEVTVPLGVFAELSIKEGSEVYLFIYHHFFDSGQRLFGFSTKLNREFFIALQSIKGIGPSLALSLLSHYSPDQILQICATNDTKSLSRIPRVGKSTSERLVFEINRRAAKWQKLFENDLANKNPDEIAGVSDMPQLELATQALVQLGYKESEAIKGLDKIRSGLEVGKINAMQASDWISSYLKIY